MAKFYDTLLGEYIQNPGVRGLGLDKIASRDFDYEMISYDDITSKAKINFREVDLKAASIYSGEDVYMTSLIYKKQKQDSVNKNQVLLDIEIPLVEVLTEMEISGVKIDRDRLKGISILLENEISFLQKTIYEKVGEKFNINSPKQVGEILFDKLALPKGKKTKTGYSVSAEVLGDLAHDYPIIQDIVNYRHYSKILSTFVFGLIDLLDDFDLLHTSYNSSVTTTGRLSSTNPNLQNIPAGDSVAGEVRDAFVSRFENGSILAFDYSQVELRLLANMSRDENLIEAFNSGLDIHHKTAEAIFGTNIISSSQRKVAKAVNFGVLYGISAFGLAKMIDISISDAKKYIDLFYESYPKVRVYLDETITFCEINGYVETLFGRRRYIANINDSNKLIKSGAEREAINMPIQGTSADIIKLSMIKVSAFIKQNNLKSLLIMQVHDELVFDVFPGEEEKLKKEVLDIMQGILKDSKVKLKVDFGIGKTRKLAK